MPGAGVGPGGNRVRFQEIPEDTSRVGVEASGAAPKGQGKTQRDLILLMLVCVSCGLLLFELFGPVVSLLLILVRCLVYWMVRLGVILHFALFGFGSVCSVGILLIGWERFPGFTGV